MRSFAALTALAALPSVFAVTLQDFKPRVSGLPAACQLVYTTPILGCSASDFGGKGCSDNCIQGMITIGPAVVLACSNANLPGNDVISAFLAGKGVKNQCPNTPDSLLSTTQTPTPTPTPTPSSTSTPDATTTTPTTTDTPTSSDTSSTAPVTSSSSASSTSSSSSSSSRTSGSSAGSSSSAAAAGSSSSTSSTQAASTPGNVSGGGSPFDTQGNTASSTTGSAYAFALFLSALLAGYLL